MTENDLDAYDMTTYLSELMDEDPDETFALIRMDLNELKSQLLEEDACYVVFAGTKSMKIYQSFLPDLIGKGFVPGIADYLLEFIFVEKYEEKRNDYIILSDSLNSGTEVDRIIRLTDGKLIRIYSYFATSSAIETIKNKHGLTDEHFINLHQITETNEYQKKSKRLKLISYVYLSSVMNDDVISFEVKTNQTLVETICIIENSIGEVLGCDDVNLEKDPVYNLKTPAYISYFLFECCKEAKNCSSHFLITGDNPNLISMNLKPMCIQILCKLEKISTGYLGHIHLDLIGSHLNYLKTTDECPIYEGPDSCTLEHSQSDDAVITDIIPVMECMPCVKAKLTVTVLQKIKTKILSNYEIS